MTTPSWLPIVFSAVGTIVALSAFAWQVHRARFNQSVDLLFRLENDFFGAAKIAQRSVAATNLLADRSDFAELEDVLDFFETVAMLTRKKALDIYMVWHTFDYWMERYYALAEPHILERQRTEPGVWEDFRWLVPRLKKLQAKKSPNDLGAIELDRFLAEESAEG
jgi:hypothetical protein